jgi:hypothetical protein
MLPSPTNDASVAQLRNLIRSYTTEFDNGYQSAVGFLHTKSRSNLHVLFGKGGDVFVPMSNGNLVKNALLISYKDEIVSQRFINSEPSPLYHLIGSTNNKCIIYVVANFLAASSVASVNKYPVYVAFDSANLSSLAEMVAAKFPERKIRVLHDPSVTVSSELTNIKFYESSVCAGLVPELFLTHSSEGTHTAALLLSESLYFDTKPASSSYFQTTMIVPFSAYKYMENVTKDLSKQQKLFLYHLLACTSLLCGKKADDFSIPVPSRTIDKYASSCDTAELQELGLIAIKDENLGLRLCREYTVDFDLYDSFSALFPTSLAVVRTTKYVDLFTGKTSTKKAKNQKSFYSNDGRRIGKIPALLRSAMDCISPRPYNFAAMVALLEIRKARIVSFIKEYKRSKRSKDPNGYKRSKEYLSLRGKYYNDKTCLLTVIHHSSADVNEDGFYVYKAAHHAQKTGRFSEYKGGLQSASREMKFASTLYVPNLYNYDLVSSQVNGLIQEFIRFGLDPTWLEAYRDNPNSKHKFAKKVGVDVETWKICLLAVIMGSTIARNPNSSVFNALTDFHRKVIKNGDGLDVRFANFKRVIKSLIFELDKWHELLIGTWPSDSSDDRSYKSKNLKKMKNAADMIAAIGLISHKGKIKTLENRYPFTPNQPCE